ncbi:MAG: nuclear transport factor 2 family protein [Bacteroidota bacterium]
MKNISLIIIFLFISLFAQSQTSGNPDLQAMVQAERDFVKMAKEQNTRDAFLAYVTDDVISSGPKGLITGKDRWKNQKPGPAWLYWDVAFSDIAASGDFGYNTGPWEFRKTKSPDEKPVAFGEFNSIWKKQADGTWKNALDIGIGHDEGPLVGSIKLATSATPLVPSTKSSGGDEKNKLTELEKKFIEESKQNKKSAYYKYLAKESRIVHSGRLPAITPEDKQKFLSEAATPANVVMVSGDIASSNDLGYFYGTGDIEVTDNGKRETRIASYLRIWKKEDGRSWKIVLDVLSY